MTNSSFRFWTTLSENTDAAAVTERARVAEALGFEAVMATDHLTDSYAAIPLVAHAAAVTQRIKIGTHVLNNDLRHPLVLAQELASVDRLSSGRLIIGMGAGWNAAEYKQAGLVFDNTSRRVERLRESVAVLKDAFAGPVSFRGAHYTVEGLERFIRPLQQPHPPFLIGGGGVGSLTLAAQEAQIVGLAPRVQASVRSVSAEATDEKLAWVRHAAGERFSQIAIETYPAFENAALITDRAHTALRALSDEIRASMAEELTIDELDASPHVLIGSIDHLAEKLLAMRDRWGISVVLIRDPIAFAPLIERMIA